MKKVAVFWIALAALAAPLPAPGDGKREVTAVNVLLITLDTTRADRIGIYGAFPRLTPNIDRMARRGVVFTRAFSHDPMTLPAHANIMTGHTPLYHGVADNNGYRLDGRFLTLAEHLRGHGYETAAFVSSFVLDHGLGLDQGFGLYHEPVARDTLPASESVAAARRWIGGQKGKWFCWLHLWDPHFPYTPPAPFDRLYAADPYSGEIAYVDSELGGSIPSASQMVGNRSTWETRSGTVRGLSPGRQTISGT